MKKWIQKLFPIMAALVLAFGSSLSVYASDTEHLSYLNYVNEYMFSNGYPVYKYMLYFYSSEYDYTGLIVSEQPFFYDDSQGAYFIWNMSDADFHYYSVTCFYESGIVTYNDDFYTVPVGESPCVAGYIDVPYEVYNNYNFYNGSGTYVPERTEYYDLFPEARIIAMSLYDVDLFLLMVDIVGVLPVVMVVVVGYVGLRKAWHFIHGILNKA